MPISIWLLLSERALSLPASLEFPIELLAEVMCASIGGGRGEWFLLGSLGPGAESSIPESRLDKKAIMHGKEHQERDKEALLMCSLPRPQYAAESVRTYQSKQNGCQTQHQTRDNQTQTDNKRQSKWVVVDQ